MADTKITLKELLEAGCHFGHQSQRWNPKMKSYIFATKDKVHIFDLVKTKEGLEAACAFVKATTSQAGKVLFVGTKRQAKEIVKETAQKARMPYVSERWLGGTITNWEQIKKSIDKLEEMKEKKEKGEYKDYTKKEQLLIDREIERLERFFGGLTALEGLPEAIFVVDIKKEEAAVLEANKKGVKVVAIVDTNSNPDLVDYVIPANDDAVGSIELIVKKIGEACKRKSAKTNKK